MVTAMASNWAPHPALWSSGGSRGHLTDPGPEGPQPSGTSLPTTLPPPLRPHLCSACCPLGAFPAPPPEPSAPTRPHSPYPVQLSPWRVSPPNRLCVLRIHSGLSALLSHPCHTHTTHRPYAAGAGILHSVAAAASEPGTQTDAQPGTRLGSTATE